MAGRRNIFEQAVLEGNSAAWDQEWQKAIAAYRTALQEFPEDTNVLTNLGLALLELNLLDEALIVYQHTARLSPGEPLPVEKCANILERLGRKNEAAQAYVAIAEVYAAKRDIARATENWGRGAALVPDNMQARSRLAMVYERTNRLKDAVTEYIAVARIFQKQSDGQRSFQAVQRAVQLDPRSPEALQALELVQRGKPLPEPKPIQVDSKARAKSAFADRATLFRDDKSSASRSGKPEKKYNPLETAREMALAKLADLMFDIGDEDIDSGRQTGSLLKKAMDPFRNARDNKSQIITYLGQAIDLQTKGDANGAAAYYEKALRAGMEHGALYLSLGGIYFDTERYEDALKQFQPATSHLDYAPGAHYGLGLSYGRDGDMKNAIRHLLDCLRLVDMTTVPVGQTEVISGMYENFHESLGRNQNEEELVKIGESLVAFLSGEDWQQRVQQARQQLNLQQEGVALAPLADILSMPGAEHAMESMSLIEKYVAKRWYDTAMDEAHRAVEHAPTYLPLHIKMGEILLALNNTEAAVEKYTAIAEVYQVRGEPTRAGKMYEQVVRLTPMDLEKRTKLINLLIAQGRTEDAIHHYMEMADAHQDLADLDKARQTYSEALRLAGGPGVDRRLAVQIMHHIGDIDVQKLDFRTALRTYEQLKGLNPSDENARLQLLNLHFRLGQIRQAVAETDDLIRFYLGSGALSKIVNLLEGLVQEYPDDLGLRARMARIYQEAGRVGDAVSQYDVLLEAHVQSGRTAEAIQTAQAIIALDPPDAEHYKQLLARLQSPK